MQNLNERKCEGKEFNQYFPKRESAEFYEQSPVYNAYTMYEPNYPLATSWPNTRSASFYYPSLNLMYPSSSYDSTTLENSLYDLTAASNSNPAFNFIDPDFSEDDLSLLLCEGTNNASYSQGFIPYSQRHSTKELNASADRNKCRGDIQKLKVRLPKVTEACQELEGQNKSLKAMLNNTWKQQNLSSPLSNLEEMPITRKRPHQPDCLQINQKRCKKHLDASVRSCLAKLEELNEIEKQTSIEELSWVTPLNAPKLASRELRDSIRTSFSEIFNKFVKPLWMMTSEADPNDKLPYGVDKAALEIIHGSMERMLPMLQSIDSSQPLTTPSVEIIEQSSSESLYSTQESVCRMLRETKAPLHNERAFLDRIFEHKKSQSVLLKQQNRHLKWFFQDLLSSEVRVRLGAESRINDIAKIESKLLLDKVRFMNAEQEQLEEAREEIIKNYQTLKF